MTGTPGWYPDPTGRFEHRYHNGQAWTADVAVDGQRYVDPVSAAAPGAGPRLDAPSPGKGLATAGMVCGIVGLSVAWMPFVAYAGLVVSVVAIVLSVVGFRRSRPTGAGRTFAAAGIATGACGIAVSALGIWLTAAVLDLFDDFNSPEPAEVRITSCEPLAGVVAARGTITNVGDERQSYSIAVEVTAGASADVERVAVDDVDPGERREFTAGASVDAGGAEPSCRVVAVDGPLPFGLDPDGLD